jgi:o-succinylbenzoate synthase
VSEAALDWRAAAVELAAMELVEVQLPMRQVVESAHGVESVRRVVLVRALGTDGREGWGECSALEAATYTAEHTDSAWTALADRLVPAVLAGRPDIHAASSQPMAWTAVEVAVSDLGLRRRSRSLVEAMGGGPGLAWPWTRVFGVQADLSTLVKLVGEHLDRHPGGAVKVKIRPGWDVQPLAALRAAWPDLDLSADANGAYRADDADDLTVLAALADVIGPNGYLEQPAAAGDQAGLGRLARDLPRLAVALDESLTGPDDLAAALEHRPDWVLNIKPSRLGGAAVTRALAASVEGAGPGVSAFLGGLFETGVGRAAALAMGAAPGLRIGATDLGPSSHYFDEDVTDPLELDADGRMVVPAGPGIGAVPRPDRLSQVVTRRLLIRRG